MLDALWCWWDSGCRGHRHRHQHQHQHFRNPNEARMLEHNVQRRLNIRNAQKARRPDGQHQAASIKASDGARHPANAGSKPSSGQRASVDPLVRGGVAVHAALPAHAAVAL